MVTGSLSRAASSEQRPPPTPMGPLVIVSPAEGPLGTRGSLVPRDSCPNPATHELCDLSQVVILHLLSSSVKWGQLRSSHRAAVRVQQDGSVKSRVYNKRQINVGEQVTFRLQLELHHHRLVRRRETEAQPPDLTGLWDHFSQLRPGYMGKLRPQRAESQPKCYGRPGCAPSENGP